MSFPKQINILEGEQVEIPFPFESMTKNNFAVIKFTSESGTIENSYDKATYNNHEGTINGVIKLSGLEAGTYTIKLIELGTNIDLIVHRGVYWETDNFILKSHSLVELRENQNFIRVSHVEKIEENSKEGEETIQFKINNYGKNTRVHFYAFQFLPNNIFEMYKNLMRD